MRKNTSCTSQGTPLHLSFTNSSPLLLNGLFQYQSTAGDITELKLSVRGGDGTNGADGTPLTYTFSSLRVGSFAENNLSGSLSGTATLLVQPR
jgi:hypothetical protein